MYSASCVREIDAFQLKTWETHVSHGFCYRNRCHSLFVLLFILLLQQQLICKFMQYLMALDACCVAANWARRESANKK